MNQKQRICHQRQKVREALGILQGVSEMFGAEERAMDACASDFEVWQDALDKFERWVFDESPIA